MGKFRFPFCGDKSYYGAIMNLKKIVDERLSQLKLGAVEAATAAGIERTFIRDIVEGKKKSVRADKLPLLAKALKLDAAALAAGKLLPADSTNDSNQDDAEFMDLWKNASAEDRGVILALLRAKSPLK